MRVLQALGDFIITVLWIGVLALLFGMVGATILLLVVMARWLWSLEHCG